MVLAYHRVASEGPHSLRNWRISPAKFDEQIGYLKAIGAYVTKVKDWFAQVSRCDVGAIERSFAITFDDGFLDFAIAAWPILARHGFSAEVFVPTGYIGNIAAWDGGHGTSAPLLNWSHIKRLAMDGISFGSHGNLHRSFAGLDHSTLRRELIDSKMRLEDELGTSITTLAYPYGVHNGEIRRLTAELGYLFGLTTELGSCTKISDRFQLPRFEVDGSAPFEEFTKHIGSFRRE